MHELAIAEAIAGVVEERAAALGCTRVKGIRLRIGEAGGVVTDALTFCFEMVAAQRPLLEGARLSIDRVPHTAWCAGCEQAFEVQGYVAQCPACNVWSEKILTGQELQVVELEIETREEAG